MEAKLGSNPSFVWCSLLSARDVIKEGSIWSIGDGCTWDRSKVNAWFLPSSRAEVLRVRLGSLDCHGKLVWNENKPRTFSVKSAYQVALRIHRSSSAEHSRARDDKLVWNRLWGLPIPPKVRNFVWRACSDILPTRANLVRQKVHMDPKCAICGEHDEAVIHILWQCPLARNVWALVRGRLQKCDSSALDFLNLARTLVVKLSREELETWAMVACSI
ncbi:hypothetical protein SO802_033763 [Lithocarpus litseifolius]|uniref:Reverse transcriptase zinc-binding domain-containing protein n=1 Tax=Lithocarpus litseifolius TaxID=425828 RepID=A0AAW2BFM7_9ROSI